MAAADSMMSEEDSSDNAGPIDDIVSGEGEDSEDGTTNGDAEGNMDVMSDDPELEEIKQRVLEMEAEAAKLRQLSAMERELSDQMSSPSTTSSSPMKDNKEEIDTRSIYVGNVDYSSSAEELEQHFRACGAINRVTIPVDKFKGTPKGFAYIEFSDKDAVTTAMALDESLFKGRQVKVAPKRTNIPGVTTTDRPPRGGGRGRYRGRRPYFSSYGGGYRSRGYRGRRGGGPFFSPY